MVAKLETPIVLPLITGSQLMPPSMLISHSRFIVLPPAFTRVHNTAVPFSQIALGLEDD
jgi:hypothetical protein